MSHVLTLLPDPASERIGAALRMAAASGARHRSTRVQSWAEAEQVAGAQPADLLVFEPYLRNALARTEISKFGRGFPGTGLLSCTSFRNRPAHDVAALLQLGIAGIIDLDEDGAAPTRAILNHALSRSSGARIWEAAEERVPDRLRRAVEWLAYATDRPVTPAEFAEAHFACEKTLANHLQEAGLPSPNRLIVRFRLLHAVVLLTDRSRTVENVANALKFPSADALRMQMKRTLNLMPAEARKYVCLRVFMDHTGFRKNRRPILIRTSANHGRKGRA